LQTRTQANMLSTLRPLMRLDTHDLLPHDALSSAATILSESNRVGKYYTKDELVDNEITPAIYEILNSDTSLDQREKFLAAKIQQIASSITWRIRDWRVIVPLENLVLQPGKKLCVGEVSFFTFGQGYARKMLRQIKISLQNNPRYADKPDLVGKLVKQRKETDISNLLGKCCATSRGVWQAGSCL
jgi:hypothetical protein